ncbi:Adenine nucleotide alpha hydrolases-like protein [Glarea lozoyensis ATCC 20868]|uniref:Cytoplasmic tRNA 2-thiolation protein 1 n=1 Tax=Glarea lozoyensis (strain ATCC 20868 / MF5171) TaxID=1116229 RepID=S3D716_GLAL2|nr:Adenine nucleotide alpha hydrolases-like protein [Glarea lozoyensis ATCC 20868]EPE32944.1 Adenine nucleotide alpha hydrolases-like protein [Glarea lozoyensis ATCC 20868]
MAPALCANCKTSRALIIRPKNHQKLCKECFIAVFEAEIHHTIITTSLFSPGDKIAIGASGGKDSTVLASVLKTLNERHNYGLELVLLSIDEGIKGYRDDSLETVKRNAVQYDMPLKIVGYDELYGWTMDQVVEVIGKKGNCTYCGVFRRQALDRGAKMLGIKHVVTGHNADDVAETILMNLLRGDLPRLARSTSIVTGDATSDVRRSKPLKYAYEKEIVLYAHHKKLDYFTTECLYSPEAFRGSARSLIKNLERVRPSAILDVVRSGEDMAKLVPEEVTGISQCKSQKVSLSSADGEDEGAGGCGSANGRSSGGEMAAMEKKLQQDETASSREIDMSNPIASGQNHDRLIKKTGPIKPVRIESSKKLVGQTLGTCKTCGYMSSQEICKACTLLEGLNKNRPKMEIEIDVEEEESSTLRRRMEGVALAAG